MDGTPFLMTPLNDLIGCFLRAKLAKGGTKKGQHTQHSGNNSLYQQKAIFTMALELFTKKFMDAASKAYKNALAKDLNKMGE